MITEKQREDIAASAASQWARCYKCDGIRRDNGATCSKELHLTCPTYRDAYKGALIALETLGRWQKRKDNAKGKK